MLMLTKSIKVYQDFITLAGGWELQWPHFKSHLSEGTEYLLISLVSHVLMNWELHTQLINLTNTSLNVGASLTLFR